MPPSAGQHIDPGITKPNSLQRAWAVQSALDVGLSVGVALGEADGAGLGELVGEPEGTAVGPDVAHTPLAALAHVVAPGAVAEAHGAQSSALAAPGAARKVPTGHFAVP